MFALGLDIGYSNLKLAFGEKGSSPQTLALPAGAGPLELLPQRLNGGVAQDVIQVTVNDQKWVAGVEPERLQGWDRELHLDYPNSHSYRALFYAGLLLTERERIDVLITGLPVNQYFDAERRKTLIERLKGEHAITPKRTVTVESVIVIPQPAGAYMDVVNSQAGEPLLEILQEGRTIVIDPGFFSVDWVALEQGEIRDKSSGTSLKAMSMLLEEINRLIQEDHGACPGVDKLEKAIRAGKRELILLGQSVPFQEYFDQASRKVAANALIPMRRSMREDGVQTDIVLLAGGGAEAYRSAAQEIFPNSHLVVSDDAVLANARGFWHCA
ncbi:ParM/StbA family protein [Azomonas macrocytogenes]|uniref:Plasmid segregation protein ParM n=1 Tax=Azomonas macrocytogenes TaxID=69962 RepID=A0A839T7N3_AZOMA|nr:ParM/StbA family protein [Azomonas macrocytogenes]MBB3105471.1 plasmid segregation protein ParM [Azomonas macrocytogenes]